MQALLGSALAVHHSTAASSAAVLPGLPAMAAVRAHWEPGIRNASLALRAVRLRAPLAPQMREAFLAKLRAALASHPGADVYMYGHSRGGAMAVMATFDLAAEKAAEAGLADPGNQLKLWTMGQPRVGDCVFSSLLEGRVAERWRIVNSGDPTPHGARHATRCS